MICEHVKVHHYESCYAVFLCYIILLIRRLKQLWFRLKRRSIQGRKKTETYMIWKMRKTKLTIEKKQGAKMDIHPDRDLQINI